MGLEATSDGDKSQLLYDSAESPEKLYRPPIASSNAFVDWPAMSKVAQCYCFQRFVWIEICFETSSLMGPDAPFRIFVGFLFFFIALLSIVEPMLSHDSYPGWRNLQIQGRDLNCFIFNYTWSWYLLLVISSYNFRVRCFFHVFFCKFSEFCNANGLFYAVNSFEFEQIN